ncbi:MAG: TolC family protein [Bacteroidota bacterium]
MEALARQSLAPRWWGPALLWCLVVPLAAQAQVQTLDLSALETRFIERSSQMAQADAEAVAARARYDALRGDYGFNVNGDLTYYPQGGPSGADFEELDFRGSLNLEWELLSGGWVEKQRQREAFELRALSREARAVMARSRALYDFRALAIEAMKAEVLAEGAAAAAGYADGVQQNTETLYATRDVLLSDLITAQQKAGGYRGAQSRYMAQRDLLLETLTAQVGEVSTLNLRRIEGLPPEPNWSVLREQILRSARADAIGNLAGLRPTGGVTNIELDLFAGFFFRQESSQITTPNRNNERFDVGPQVGLRFAVPLTLFRQIRADRTEARAIDRQQTLAVTTAEDDVSRILTNAITLYNDNYSDYDVLQARTQLLEARIGEGEAQVASGARGIRLTPIELSLLRAELEDARAAAEAQRFDIWKQYYFIQSLAATR